MLRYPLHFQPIGEDEPGEAEVFAEQVRHDRLTERTGSVRTRIQGGKLQVCRHHTPDTVADQRPEGVQFDAIQSLPVVLDHGEVQVAVHIRVAVAGEMLSAS